MLEQVPHGTQQAISGSLDHAVALQPTEKPSEVAENKAFRSFFCIRL